MNTVSFDGRTVSTSKVVCVGRNFVGHAKELGNAIPESPVIFIKPNSAISHELMSVAAGEPLHYETELCFLIESEQLVGVGVGLDLTKRQLQSELKSKGLPWERAKAFSGAAILSDFVPLSAAIDTLHFTLHIDDALIQEGAVSGMLFSPEDVLSDCETFLAFEDGDVLMTGTPEGVGEVRQGARYLAQVFSGDQKLLSCAWVAK